MNLKFDIDIKILIKCIFKLQSKEIKNLISIIFNSNISNKCKRIVT